MQYTALRPARAAIATLVLIAYSAPAAAQIGPRVPATETPPSQRETVPMTYFGAELLGAEYTILSGNGNRATVLFGLSDDPSYPIQMRASGGRLDIGLGAMLRPSADGNVMVANQKLGTIERDPAARGCIKMNLNNTGYLACPNNAATQPEWSKLLSGDWTTASGTLTFTPVGRLLRGTIRRPDSNGVPVVVRRFAIWGWLGSNTIRGAWAYPEDERGGEVAIELARDGKSFTGTLGRLNQPAETWTGKRKETASSPAPATGGTGGTTGGSGSTGSSAGQPGGGTNAPTAPAGFDSLRRYDVRLDRVVRASDEARVDVFVTLRNATQGILHGTSSALKVRLEDDEGVGKEAYTAYRATPEGRAHFASTPVIEAGGQLRVKFTFHAGEGGTPARVAIIEGDKRVSYDLDF